MLVDYWLASELGRVWLRLRAVFGLREVNVGLPGECAQVARGEHMPAGRLWRAEDFAARVWWRTGMCVFLLACAVAAGTLVVAQGRIGTDIAVTFLLAGICFAAMPWRRWG